MPAKRRDVASEQAGGGDFPASVERLDDSVGAELYAEFKANERADLIDGINEGADATSAEVAGAFRLARSWPARVMTLWPNHVSPSMADDGRQTILSRWMEDLSALLREFNAINRLFASHGSSFRPSGSMPMRVGHLTFQSATLAGYGLLRLFLWRLWDCEDSRRMDDAISDSCPTEFLRNGIAVRCSTDAVVGVRDERQPIDVGFPAELAWMFTPSHLEFLQRLKTEFLEDHGIDESVPSAIETYGEIEQRAWEATLPKGESIGEFAEPKLEAGVLLVHQDWQEDGTRDAFPLRFSGCDVFPVQIPEPVSQVHNSGHFRTIELMINQLGIPATTSSSGEKPIDDDAPKVVWSQQFTKKDWAQYLNYENADSMKDFVRINRRLGRADDEANKQKCRFDVSLIREKRPDYDDSIGILGELQKKRQGSESENRSENRR